MANVLHMLDIVRYYYRTVAALGLVVFATLLLYGRDPH